MERGFRGTVGADNESGDAGSRKSISHMLAAVEEKVLFNGVHSERAHFGLKFIKSTCARTFLHLSLKKPLCPLRLTGGRH